MNNAYLMTGGNIGDRAGYLATAKRLIMKECGTLVASSGLYETAAWGNNDQPAFLNQALAIETDLSAIELLHSLLAIEKNLGRVREKRFGPRIIDIDILLYNDDIIRVATLEVPHPRMHLRRFVLTPLAEIAGEKKHPVLGKTIAELLSECPDELPVTRLD